MVRKAAVLWRKYLGTYRTWIESQHHQCKFHNPGKVTQLLWVSLLIYQKKALSWVISKACFTLKGYWLLERPLDAEVESTRFWYCVVYAVFFENILNSHNTHSRKVKLITIFLSMKDLQEWSLPCTHLEDMWKIARQAAVFNIKILSVCVQGIRMIKVFTFIPEIWVFSWLTMWKILSSVFEFDL